MISKPIFQRLDRYEVFACAYLNRFSQRNLTKRFFAAVSRLGDGVFWYGLMALIALLDFPFGAGVALHMGAAALCGCMIYKIVKSGTIRERPHNTWEGIQQTAPQLDVYSFPSGHTLHAVNFSIIASHYYPQLGPSLFLFSALIALSRVILGLHYPSDVVVGALVGSAIAFTSIQLV